MCTADPSPRERWWLDVGGDLTVEEVLVFRVSCHVLHIIIIDDG